MKQMETEMSDVNGTANVPQSFQFFNLALILCIHAKIRIQSP